MSPFYQASSFLDDKILPTIFVIPSGIGCSIGGFAGDAIPSARLLALSSGCLITHPNVMNGASLYWNDQRIQYVEGFGLDRFTMGAIALQPVRKQSVGILFDAGIESDLLQRHLQVVDGCRASLGLNLGPYIITDQPVEVDLKLSLSGSSWGIVRNPETLIKGGIKLKEQGATSIAVVTRFPDEVDDVTTSEYRHGCGVDPFAGAEATISHLLVKFLGIPCAHSPATKTLPLDYDLDPRAAGEELGYTFLNCVLVGLSRAPNLVPIDLNKSKEEMALYAPDLLSIEQVGAVVVPKGAIGSPTVLACIERKIPIILVNNSSAIDVSLSDLCLGDDIASGSRNKFFQVDNYLEAAGLIMLLRNGINPESLYRPLPKIRELRNH